MKIRSLSSLLFISILVLLSGCDSVGGKSTFKADFTTEFQAVILDSGQAYFGRIESAETRFIVLSEVYYVRGRVDDAGKPAGNMLIKRGREWHAPDRMHINTDHIVMIEPVSPDSRVAELIADLRGGMEYEGSGSKEEGAGDGSTGQK